MEARSRAGRRKHQSELPAIAAGPCATTHWTIINSDELGARTPARCALLGAMAQVLRTGGFNFNPDRARCVASIAAWFELESGWLNTTRRARARLT